MGKETFDNNDLSMEPILVRCSKMLQILSNIHAYQCQDMHVSRMLAPGVFWQHASTDNAQANCLAMQTSSTLYTIIWWAYSYMGLCSCLQMLSARNKRRSTEKPSQQPNSSATTPAPQSNLKPRLSAEPGGPQPVVAEPTAPAAMKQPCLDAASFDPAVTWASSREGDDSFIDLHIDPAGLIRCEPMEEPQTCYLSSKDFIKGCDERGQWP